MVATNKEQLSHSIKAVYGNAFDASGYLGRFFDQEYTLPEPDNKRYAKYLLEDIYKVINDKNIGRFYSPLQKRLGTNDHITDLFAFFSDSFGIPLRDQGQIAHRLKAIMFVYNKPTRRTIYLDYLLFLLMLRRKNEETFNQLTQQKKDLNLGDINLLVEKHLKQSTINVPGPREHSRSSLVPKKIASLISEYRLAAGKSTQEIKAELIMVDEPTELQDLFLNEAKNSNSQANGQSTYLSIADYSKLVLQVGHLEN